MAQSLKGKTISGMIWTSVQRFGTMIISIITNMILARLLSPNDFGVIGMLMVFIGLADTFVNGGFASAVIQKKEPSNEDYSTVFYWNLSVAVIFFIILFLSAPAIAKFYHMPQLTTLLRVLGIILIISGFNIIQNSQLIKQLNFKRLAMVNIISNISGAVLGITLAFKGYGVWSLAMKMILTNLVQSLILWFGSRWRPLKIFSMSSFRALFKFGSLMMLSTFTEKLVYYFQSLVIGRNFSASDLGYYTQARTLNSISQETLPHIVDQVMFPVFSSIQNNKSDVTNALRKSLKALVFLNFPLMLLLFIISEPMIIILFSDKWIDSIQYFQIFSLSGLVISMNSSNVNVIKSLGKSNYILINTIIKRIITLIFIFIGLKFGIIGIAVGTACSFFVWFPINAFFTYKLISYSFFKQIKDITPTFLLSITTMFLTLLISRFTEFHLVINMIIDILVFSVLYIVGAWMFKLDGFYVYLGIIQQKINK